MSGFDFSKTALGCRMAEATDEHFKQWEAEVMQSNRRTSILPRRQEQDKPTGMDRNGRFLYRRGDPRAAVPLFHQEERGMGRMIGRRVSDSR